MRLPPGAVQTLWDQLPVGTLLALAGAAAVLIVALVRAKFTEPVTFATSKDIAALKKDLDQKPSRDEVNGLGQRVSAMESFTMTVHEHATQANTRSTRALREVARLRDSMGRLEKTLEDVQEKVEPLGRIEERTEFLVRRAEEEDRRLRERHQ